MEEFELKKTIEESNQEFEDIITRINIEDINNKLSDLEKESLNPDFFKQTNRSKQVLKEISILKSKIKDLEEMKSQRENMNLSYELYKIDELSYEELEKESLDFFEKLEDFKMKLLLSGKYDSLDAILTINAGAGGTESCDWVAMLNRMYERWSLNHGFKYEILDVLNGDEAGIKSISILIKGSYAFGYLNCEKGVHRLVRISPFDSNSRRHTSFAAVSVSPEIEEDIEVNLKKEDMKIETFRSSGAGGQHVNTTDSAVRITHLPTKIVISSQNDRSQIKNMETAVKLLKAKLYELQVKSRQEELDKIKGSQSKIEWGSQIRSYVFCPYKLVKDHRTNYEENNIDKVMDGQIDKFIQEYLKLNF